MKTQLDISGMEDLVKDTIQVALAEALTKNSDKVIRNLVQVALSSCKNGYSKDTILTSALHEAIKSEAKKQVSDWVEMNKVHIRQAVAEAISKSGFLTAEWIAARVVSCLEQIKGTIKPFGHPEEIDEE